MADNAYQICMKYSEGFLNKKETISALKNFKYRDSKYGKYTPNSVDDVYLAFENKLIDGDIYDSVLDSLES